MSVPGAALRLKLASISIVLLGVRVSDRKRGHGSLVKSACAYVPTVFGFCFLRYLYFYSRRHYEQIVWRCRDDVWVCLPMLFDWLRPVLTGPCGERGLGTPGCFGGSRTWGGMQYATPAPLLAENCRIGDHRLVSRPDIPPPILPDGRRTVVYRMEMVRHAPPEYFSLLFRASRRACGYHIPSAHTGD